MSYRDSFELRDEFMLYGAKVTELEDLEKKFQSELKEASNSECQEMVRKKILKVLEEILSLVEKQVFVKRELAQRMQTGKK